MKKVETSPKSRMAARWLQAFGGHDQNLIDSLNWELSRPDRERAAETLFFRNDPGRVDRCNVGLLFNRSDIVRSFSGDVWSVTADDGTLRPTRHHSQSIDHSECFLKKGAFPVAVITRCRIEGNLWRQILSVAKQNNLPVYKYAGGEGGWKMV